MTQHIDPRFGHITLHDDRSHYATITDLGDECMPRHPEPKPDRWKCANCGAHYVVPPLARDCESRHRALAEGARS